MKWCICGLIIVGVYLFCLPNVHSLTVYGGNIYSMKFNKCYDMNVTIVGNDVIDEGEYTVLTPNCTRTWINTYRCNCTDKWWFNVSFLPTTKNNYIFYYNYTIKEESNDGGGGSGGGHSSGGGTTTYNQTTGYNTTTINSTVPSTPVENNTSPNENLPAPVAPVVQPVADNTPTNTVVTPTVPNNTSTLQPPNTNPQPPPQPMNLGVIVSIVLGVLLFAGVLIVYLIGVFMRGEKEDKVQTRISAIKSKPKITTEGEIQYIMAKIVKKHTK